FPISVHVFQLGEDNVESKSQRWNRSLAAHLAGLSAAFVLLFQFADSAYAQSVNLAWDPVSDTNLAGYQVYRSEQSGVYTTSPVSGSSALTTTAFTDSTVQSGHTYYYVVAAVNTSGGQSPYSNEVQAVIASPTTTTPPPPPTNQPPTVTAGPNQTITLP